MECNFSTHTPQTVSQPYWQGSDPQRFKGGKSHSNHPRDQLDSLLASRKPAQFEGIGKRQYGTKRSEEYSYRPHMRLYDQKYKKTSLFDVENLQKLIKVPGVSEERDPSHQPPFDPSALTNKYQHVGRSKLVALQRGQKKAGIYRNFYKSQSVKVGMFHGNEA